MGDAGFADWVLGSMSSGIVAVDAAGALVLINAGARRVLGLEEREERLRGRDCRRALRAQPAVVRLLLDTLEGRRPLSRAELVLEPTAEQPRGAIGFTLSPVRDGSGAIRGAAMIFRDLAPIERSDEHQRLRERLAALGEMAAGLAHEIRNPLAGMEVLAGLLLRRLGDRPEERALLGQLTGELRALAATVTASLDFVRPVALAPAPVDPVALVEEAFARARSRVPFSGRVERRFAAELPALRADAEQLRGVVSNLILNALEALRAHPSPRLDLAVESRKPEAGGTAVRVEGGGVAPPRPPAREVVFTVSDNGPGVREEHREKIFHPFFTTKQNGSGVGLANAQKVALSHGGVIEFDSRPGAGSTFRVHLPADEPRSEA